MRHTDLRERARAILNGSQCVSPASVYDALSARVAASVGFEVGLLSGSVSSATVLGAPAELKGRIASSDEMDRVTLRDEYARRQKDYLR